MSLKSEHLIDLQPLHTAKIGVDHCWKEEHDDECLLCGRPLETAKAGCHVEMTPDLMLVSSEMPEEERAAIDSQGCFPVGSG